MTGFPIQNRFDLLFCPPWNVQNIWMFLVEVAYLSLFHFTVQFIGYEYPGSHWSEVVSHPEMMPFYSGPAHENLVVRIEMIVWRLLAFLDRFQTHFTYKDRIKGHRAVENVELIVDLLAVLVSQHKRHELMNARFELLHQILEPLANGIEAGKREDIGDFFPGRLLAAPGLPGRIHPVAAAETKVVTW